MEPPRLTPPLWPLQVAACRIYTTAAFAVLNTPLRDQVCLLFLLAVTLSADRYNTPLRDQSDDRPPHPFPVTINFISDGISKLRAVEGLVRDMELKARDLGAAAAAFCQKLFSAFSGNE